MKTVVYLFSFAFFFPLLSLSEPWLSNRFAQNCASCHAPGRLNLPPQGRRCTLSCQGCHYDPNGGGLRNQYGIWNQQRFLRSFKSAKLMGHKPTPAPHNKQNYMNVKTQKNGSYPVGTTTYVKQPWVADTAYTNKVYKDWHKEADNFSHFLSRIPAGDPYRLERNFEHTVGGDFRYLWGNVTGDVEADYAFGMSLDLGVRIRPIRENLSFVLEARFLNTSPNNTELEQTVTTGSQVRKAYLLVDDLMYNSYLMAGLYLPMFGHSTPDHTRLSSQLSGINQYTVYKAVGIGTAPNVPFFNINLVAPLATPNFYGDDSSSGQDEGFVANAGFRAVTKSLSGTLSYLNTENKVDESKRTLVALSGGAMLGPFIFNGELLNFQYEKNGKDSGFVGTFEAKYRYWRENYIVASYSEANTTPSRKKGQAHDTSFGFKTFLIPGVEFEILNVMSYVKQEEPSVTITNTNRLQGQVHLFF